MAAALFVTAGCGDDGAGSDGDIKVGVLASLTGYLATNDTAMSDGVRLAADAINADGGIDGRDVSVEVVDVASSGADAATSVQKMVAGGNLDGVIGGYLSAAVSAVAPALESNKIPMVVTAVIPEPSDWAFTVTPPVASWVETQAKYLKDEVKAKRVGVLFSQTPYGQQIEKALREVAGRYGLEVVAAEGVAADATDVSPQLIRLRRAGVDAIVDELFGAQHLVMAKNAAALRLNIPIVGGPDALATYEKASKEYDDITFLAFPTQVPPRQIASPEQRRGTERFLKAWEAKSHPADTPVFAAGQGWDAMMVLADALRRPDEPSGDKLRDALESTQIQGATNRFAYKQSDHSGQAERPQAEVPWAILSVASGQPEVVYAPAGGSR